MSADIPDPRAVLEQLEEIKRKYLEAQNNVASVRATGFDQDRLVSVTVIGLGEVSGITIAPAAASPEDVEKLEQRILQAFQSANNQARDQATRILSPLNISIPQPAPRLAAPSAPALPPRQHGAPSPSPELSPVPPPSPLPGLRLPDAPAVPELSAPEPALPEPAESELDSKLANHQHHRPRW